MLDPFGKHSLTFKLIVLACVMKLARCLRDFPLTAGGETTGRWQSVTSLLTSAPGAEGSNDFFLAFGKSFLMIMVTELGDETFIIAALMAMRHPRLVVYAGAMAALAGMTVISTVIGYALPNLISRKATHHAATILYTIFGLRLLWIAWNMPANNSNQGEVEEVQQKLAEAEQAASQSRTHRFFAALCTPVLVEALVLTFLAEWGDRSQIATITLAAVYNPYGVTIGAIIGHMICTGAAVLGGSVLAMRIAPRHVAFVGGTVFLLFALNSLFSREG